MISLKTSPNAEMNLVFWAAFLVSIPLLAGAASAQSAPARSGASPASTDPAQIDRAVSEFTGAAIGEIGGARVPADRRLRLAACGGPLDVAWHGRNRTSVQVACPGPQSWRIFIATRPAESARSVAPSVSRGDPIAVVVRGRGFSVQQGGEAMENGAVGDWIAVRMSRDAAPVRARIERPGLAVIPAR